MQSVVVDAPEDRACELADRREADHPDRLHAPLDRKAAQRREEHDPGDRSEPELLVEGREMVSREQRREERDARGGSQPLN